MTSWRFASHLQLFLFLSLMKVSKEGCHDYFDPESDPWQLTNVTLLNTKNRNDVVECSLEHLCIQNQQSHLCNLLTDCYQKEQPTKPSSKCAHESTTTIHVSQFKCLVAKEKKAPVLGCDYEKVCEFFTHAPTEAPTVPGHLPTSLKLMIDNKDSEIKTLRILLAVSIVVGALSTFFTYWYSKRHPRPEHHRQPPTFVNDLLL